LASAMKRDGVVSSLRAQPPGGACLMRFTFIL